MKVMRRLCVVVLLTLALAGCGEDDGLSTAADTPTAAPTASAGPPTTPQPDFLATADGELVVGCFGGNGWPVSLMPDGLTDVLSEAEARDAFAEMLAVGENQMDLGSFLDDGADTEWRLLRVDGDEYTFGLGAWTAEGPSRDASTISAERGPDGWRWTGGGGCDLLQPALKPGHTWVELHGADLDRSSTEPLIELNEIECTSARDPSPYLHDPFVVETDGSVTVYWTSTPPEGGQTCPGNPRVKQPLPLDEPLGDRQLLDGSTYPPTPVGPSLPG